MWHYGKAESDVDESKMKNKFVLNILGFTRLNWSVNSKKGVQAI